MTLETTAAMPRENASGGERQLRNIAELRLLFAASVVLSHAAALLGDDRHRSLRTLLNSEAAVQGFFILSGYLVCGSYARIQSPIAFYRRRLLRIYPAYAAAVLIFIALALTQATALGATVAWAQVPRYLVANLTTLNFIAPTIDGLFAANAMDAVNGALWSIKVELMFYALLPLLYWAARRTSFLLVTTLLVIGGVLWWPALQALGAWREMSFPLSLKFQLPGQIHFFGLGMALFAVSVGAMSRVSAGIVAALAIALSLASAGVSDAIHIAALFVLVGGVSRLPQVRDVFGGQDISFGIYLCHFPIIQILLAGGAGGWPFGLYLATVCVLAIAYGVASWRLVERPALALTRRREARA